MKKSDERHLSLRISDEMLRKFRYVCSYDGRSANSKLLIMIRQCIADYEKEFGKINLDQKKR